MDEELLRIIDLFDDDEVTTADKIDRPAAASYREMFDDFNARNPFAGGGMLVQPGFGGTRQGYKEDKLTIEPPKVLEPNKRGYIDPRSVRELDPDYRGKLIDKKTKKVIGKIYTRELNDAFEVLNVIKKNKGHAATIEEIGRLAGFVQPPGTKNAGKVNFKRTNLAFKLAVDQFDELENFKLASEKYPKIDRKKFRYLDMVAKSFANHNTTTDAVEAAAHLLPENMGMIYDLGGRENLEKGFFNVRGKLNANDKKFLLDRISVLTGENFNTKKLNNLIEKTSEVRKAKGRIATRIKLNANMNKQIKDIADDPTIKNLLTKPLNRETQTALLTRATEIVGGDASIASRRLFQMAEAMSDTTNMYKNLGIKINNNVADKIIATGKEIGGRSNRYGMSSVLYNYYGNVVDKALGATEGESFIGKYQTDIRNLLDKGESPDEIFSLTASARRNLSPYAIFTQRLKTDVNSAIKGAYIDSALSRTHKKLQEIFKGRKYNQLNTSEKAAVNSLVENFEKEKIRALNQPVNPGDVRKGAKPIYLTAEEKKNIKLPEFDLKNPPSKAITQYKDFSKNLQKAFDTSYKNVGYSMKVTEDMQTQKQLIQSLENPEQIQLARIGCPGKATGGRVGFFEGQNLQACAIKGAQKLRSTDPKNLSPGDQRNFKNLTKTAQGVRVMKNILGPAALAYEAAFALPFALYDYQAGRPGIDIAKNVATFGFMDQKLRDAELKKINSAYGQAAKLDEVGARFDELERLSQFGTRGQRIRNKKKFENILPELRQASDPFMVDGEIDVDLYLQNKADDLATEAELQRQYDIRGQERKSQFDLGDPFMAAGGGIAGLSGGIDEGPQTVSMNPDSQGLRSLKNRVRNL